jgi:hypothetical protein
MIVEILHESDRYRIDDAAIRGYLDYSFARLPEGFDYYHHTHEYGYFCVVTSFEDLKGDVIRLHDRNLRSVDDPAFWDYVELVEERRFDERMVAEILVRIDTDFMISLIFLKSNLSIEFIRDQWLI